MLLSMTKFSYNNMKNVSIGKIFFKFKCPYYPCISFQNKVNLYLKFQFGDKQAKKFRKYIISCQKNLFYAQKLEREYII